MNLPPILRGFVGKAAVSFIFRFSGLGLQLGTSILLARILGVDSYGAYTYAFTWAMLIGMMLSLGMSDLAVREVPVYLSRNRVDYARGYLLGGLVTVLITGSLAALILALLSKQNILDFEPGWGAVALVAMAHGTILILSQGMNGLQRILTSQFLESIVRQLLYVGAILLFYFGGRHLTPAILFQIALVMVLPIIAVMGTIIWRELRKAASDTPTGLAAEPGLWFLAALPLMATTFAQIMQSDLDTLMVGFLLSDADVGTYRVAARGAALVSIATMVSLQLLGPMLSRAISQDKLEEAQSLISKSALIAALSGLAICLPLGIGANAYTWLFGPDFAAAAQPLRLLLAGQFLYVLVGPSALLLVMLRRERLVLWINIGAIALNFTLNLTLIPVMGISGAAIATFASAIFSGSFFLLAVRRTSRFDPTIYTPLLRSVRQRLR